MFIHNLGLNVISNPNDLQLSFKKFRFDLLNIKNHYDYILKENRKLKKGKSWLCVEKEIIIKMEVEQTNSKISKYEPILTFKMLSII